MSPDKLLSEAKASHSMTVWVEVSFSAPHFLEVRGFVYHHLMCSPLAEPTQRTLNKKWEGIS
jgi:hypothetical protein